MFLKQSVKLIIAFTVIMLLANCHGRRAHNGLSTHLISQPLSKADFDAFCQAQHLDSARIVLAVQRHVYMPEDQSYRAEIQVEEQLNFNYGQIAESLQQPETLKSLLAYTGTLYKLIAEPVTLGNGPKIKKSINYFDRSLTCKNMFDSLYTGAWAFDCGGHAEMAKVFLDSFGHKKYFTKTVQLSRKGGDEVNHIITLVYYQENKQWYGIALDCQNGMLGPVNHNKDSALTLSQLGLALTLNDTSEFEMLTVPEADLHQKRNLMNRAFYCNVLPDTQNVYHLAYPESGYKYERLTYSMLYYSWFKSGIINQKKYKQNLVHLLVMNVPPN